MLTFVDQTGQSSYSLCRVFEVWKASGKPLETIMANYGVAKTDDLTNTSSVEQP